MKSLEYSINDIKNNIKMNKRYMAFIFCVCLFFGIIISIIDGKNYEQPRYELDDTIVQKICLDDLAKDESYYYEAIKEFSGKYSALNAYVMYLKQVALSNDNLEKLERFESKIEEYKQSYTLLNKTYREETPVICKKMENAKKYVKGHITSIQEQISLLDNRILTLKETSFTENFVTISENSLLSAKSSLKNELAIWENQLRMLQDINISELEKKNTEMDLLLLDSLDKFNGLIVEFNDYIKMIETEENYDIVYNKYLLKSYLEEAGITGQMSEEDIMNNRKNNAIIYAKSVAGLDMPQERFYTYITFFSIFGIAISFLYGAFADVNRRKNK